MATYTLQQQAFALSLIANAGSADFGGAGWIEAELKKAIQSFVDAGPAQDLIGSWSIAWGPVVYEHVLGRATNAMFVASSRDAGGEPVYVVAVAATSAHSIYDILMEDADITLRPWPYPLSADTPVPSITQGTIDGVNALVRMKDPASGDTLHDFLSGAQGAAATLVFTGHSLGGALSPALALALFGARGTGTLDVRDWGGVYLYPTAGPTVGDANYASLWAGVFPPAQVDGETWNELVWNTLDVVPHAWALLGDIDTLYTTNFVWTRCLDKIQGGLLKRVSHAGGTFVQPPNTTLDGSFAPWVGADSHSSVTYFLTEMLHQHIWAYLDLLNVPELRTLFPRMSDPVQCPTPPAGVPVLAKALEARYCL